MPRRELQLGCAWSFQEVVRLTSEVGEGHDDGGNDYKILRNIGAGGRTLVLGRRDRGSYSVAVAVHARWAECITEAHPSFRSLSVMVKGLDMANDQHVQIHVISAHLPSIVSHPAEESDECCPRTMASNHEDSHRTTILQIGTLLPTPLQVTGRSGGRKPIGGHRPRPRP